MTSDKLETYRKSLQELAARMGHDVASISEQTRMASGGQEVGDLSNAPMHLGDVGTEEYLHGLNATLLSNEQRITREVIDALHRIDAGTFGCCEGCGRMISQERLDALPYARYCTQCAASADVGERTNFNVGRPQRPKDTLAAPAEAVAERLRPADVHASGTPGGGTAMGGLAGTNVGHGDPEEPELQDATGSGNVDVEEDRATETPRSGHAGGAVGGTPAGKRSR